MALLSENPFLNEALSRLELTIDPNVLAGQISESERFLKIGDLSPDGTVVGFVTERDQNLHVIELYAVVFAEELEGEPQAISLVQCDLPYIVVEREGREVMEFSKKEQGIDL